MSRETYVLIDEQFVMKSKDGVLTDEYLAKSYPKTKSHFVISDNLGSGVNGIINHADGKRYDSKSNYEKAVRAKGCRVVGNDWNNTQWKAPIERGIQGDFNVRPQLKEAVQKVLGQ